jgi:hypothetical protein
MRLPIIIEFLFSLFLTSCKGQTDNGKTYNKDFVVSNIENLNNFTTLNKAEKSLDSMFSTYDKSIDSIVKSDKTQSFIRKRSFINNRSRILLVESTNGYEKIKDKDKIEADGFSTFCDCGILKDTIFINSGIGFFGGAGLTIKVYGTQFKSAFYEYTDDVKPYKLTAKSKFTDNVTVDSKFQYLQLDNEPNFKIEQQLTGYLTLTSNNYFSDNYDNKLDTNFVKAKMKFTCLIKKIKDLN